MLKLFIGFVVFAALALFVLKQFGGNFDMSGEKHGIDTGGHAASAPASAAAPAAAASLPAASAAAAAVAASAPASAASK